MTVPKRLTAPVTDDERKIIIQIIELMQQEDVTFGRATFLFGSIVRSLIDSAVSNQSNQGKSFVEVLSTYFELFANGVGIEAVQVMDDPIPPREDH